MDVALWIWGKPGEFNSTYWKLCIRGPCKALPLIFFADPSGEVSQD